MELPMYAVIAVDLDGTLCYGPEKDPEPIIENIEVVKRLYRAGYQIVIYTSRHPSHRKETEHWLQNNDVWYNTLIMGDRKIEFDLLIDDKAINANYFFRNWRKLI
jgi:hydroxymethylpyrimidine pyrophosphatase-like HAD family hydrolase